MWKKDGSLRLCVNFRELNRRTVPACHPLPRVQTSIENLGGNKWFSPLDQGKAYHQGFVSPDCQRLTAFVTPWGLYKSVHEDTLRAQKRACRISKVNGEMPYGAEGQHLHFLPG